MGKVIKFPKSSKQLSHVMKLKMLSDRLDNVIIDAIVREGIDPHELAGVLAHRLGSLIRSMEEKSKLWDVCEKVLKKQAVME